MGKAQTWGTACTHTAHNLQTSHPSQILSKNLRAGVSSSLLQVQTGVCKVRSLHVPATMVAISLRELASTQETARVEHATSTHSSTSKGPATAALNMCCYLLTSHIKLQPWRLLTPNVARFCCSAHSMEFSVLSPKNSDMMGTRLLVLASGLNTAPIIPHNCQSAERHIFGHGNSCTFKPFIL